MEDPALAARELGERVESAENVYEVPGDDLAADPEDGWVAVGGLVRSPDRRRVVLVETGWSQGWVLPGGGVESDDDSLQAALRREVREETGLDVRVGEPLLVERQTLASPSTSSTGWFVLYDAVARDERFADEPGEHENEIAAVSWVSDPVEAFAGPSEFVNDVIERECRSD